jgi:adenylate cyclase
VLLERAVDIDPNLAWGWSRLGWLENYSDRPERAIDNFQRAIRLSPLDPMNFNNLVGVGAANEILGRYDEALTFYRRGLQERPHAHWILRHTVTSLVGAGRLNEAAQEYRRMLGFYPDLTIAKFKNALVFSPGVVDRMASQMKQLGLPD